MKNKPLVYKADIEKASIHTKSILLVSFFS